MIQLNLLPDIKMKYIKAKRTRRLVSSMSFIVSAAAVVLLVLLLSYSFVQKRQITSLNNNIGSETSQLKSKPNINEILTVQNQLGSLTTLHNSEPATSRLFNYLYQLTPASVSINNLSVDFDQGLVTITGSADALSSVNQYIDTLKLTTYTINNSGPSQDAFKNVVLTSFGITTANSANNNQPASYTITLNYDSNIFNIADSISLSVPSTTTTRLEVQNPTDLFQVPSNSSTKGGS